MTVIEVVLGDSRPATTTPTRVEVIRLVALAKPGRDVLAAALAAATVPARLTARVTG